MAQSGGFCAPQEMPTGSAPMKEDSYSSILRERMKTILSKPAEKWAPTPPPRPPKDYMLLLLSLCAALLLCALAWEAFDKIESLFR